MIIRDLSSIAESAERFPQSPGVYIMKDAGNVPIYIGKAVNLRNRVRSYFTDTHEDRPYIPLMLMKLHHIDWIATETETEALIVEANLIRKHTPRFNIDLKDDKHYPYIKITIYEPFPRLLVVRRVEQDDSLYFGPYTDVGAMRSMTRYARAIFGIRDCNRNLPLKKYARPCVNYAIGRCSGACAGIVTESQYRYNVEMLIKFLKGQRREYVDELKKRMEEASAALQFEEASGIRDRIKLITDASNLQRVDLVANDIDCDAAGIYKGDRTLCLAILCFREGLLMSVRRFIINNNAWELDNSSGVSALMQYYMKAENDPPSTILLPESQAFDEKILGNFFLKQFGKKVEVRTPQKGTMKSLVDMAIKNARLYLMQKLPVDNTEDLGDLMKQCNLPEFPHVIEAFDISNTGGAFCVAGMVHFTEGNPDKSNYRRFKIKTVEGQNDFAMLMEAVTRRLSRLQETGKPFPDCLLIDGGLGQLHSVMEALKHFQSPPMIISLAKKDEIIYSPYCANPVALPATHPVRKLVERIRDEVHRWAISYHRNIRGKQFKTTLLKNIPGIGPKKSIALLRAFGSVSGIRAATDEEIAAVEGFSMNSAKRLRENLAEITGMVSADLTLPDKRNKQGEEIVNTDKEQEHLKQVHEMRHSQGISRQDFA
jgi:excinuclease ABC subunit C